MIAAQIALAAPAWAGDPFADDGDFAKAHKSSTDPRWKRKMEAEIWIEQAPARVVERALGDHKALLAKDWRAGDTRAFSLRLPRGCVDLLISGRDAVAAIGRRKFALHRGGLERITTCGAQRLRVVAGAQGEVSLAVVTRLRK